MKCFMIVFIHMYILFTACRVIAPPAIDGTQDPGFDPDLNEYTAGDTLDFECSVGHEWAWANTTQTITCQYQGWDLSAAVACQPCTLLLTHS